MSAKELFQKTMPFIWAKLMLGAVMVGVSAILLAVLMGLGWLFGDTGMVIMFCLWMGAIGVLRFAIMHYAGYMVKAGHVAVIAEACKTGTVPANQVEYGKKMVTERFLTSNAYFVIDKLISSAVKQIQEKLGKIGGALDFIPGMEAVTSLAQFFVSISLNYVDECCLGWTFWQKDQGAFKSAADGVVIYAQNWKALLGGAAKTMLKVLIGTVVIALAVFVPIGVLFKILKWSSFGALVLACLAAWVVKFAVMDSYIMIQMMAVYMNVAPNTQISFDLYGKFCSISSKFKELWDGAQKEPVPAGADTLSGGQNTISAATVRTNAAADTLSGGQKPIFCGQCGAKNNSGTKFCGSCGAKL